MEPFRVIIDHVLATLFRTLYFWTSSGNVL
jgi:hypothetical protein